MDEKVDVFEFLRHVDDLDFSYYDSLSEAQRKRLSLFVAARWQSCTKNVGQIVATNSLVNHFVYKFLTKHPKLLYKLMLIASSGTQKQYKWVPKKKKVRSKPETIAVMAEYHNMSTRQVEDYLPSTTLEDALYYADAIGSEDSTIKKIKNEFK